MYKNFCKLSACLQLDKIFSTQWCEKSRGKSHIYCSQTGTIKWKNYCKMLTFIDRSTPEKKTKNPTFLGKTFSAENSYLSIIMIIAIVLKQQLLDIKILTRIWISKKVGSL